MLNLYLHCGAHRVERDAVDAVPTPQPTPTWVPVPHARLIHEVESTLIADGFRIESQAHALWGDGDRYFGLTEVKNGPTPDDYGLVVGLRNSHDKSFPASLVIGTGVFVCDNLAFSGEIKIARKHTRFIERDLPMVVQRAVGQLADLRISQDHRIASYKTTKLTDLRVHDLIVRAVDARVLPVTRVPGVLDEWRRPSHEEFAEDGKTVWRLQNAFTEQLKGRNLAALPARTQALNGLLDPLCGILHNN